MTFSPSTTNNTELTLQEAQQLLQAQIVRPGLYVAFCYQHTTQHNTTQHNTPHHNTTQHNTTQHNREFKQVYDIDADGLVLSAEYQLSHVCFYFDLFCFVI